MNENRPSSFWKSSRLLSVVTIKTHLKFKFVLFCLCLLVTAGVFSVLGTKIAIAEMIQKGIFTDDVFIYKLGLMCRIIVLIQLFFLAIAFCFFLLVAHVITGPIFNMEKIFDRMKMGDISMTVRFRKGDDLQITASKLNEALLGLRQSLSKEREEEYQLVQRVSKISSVLKESDQKSIASELEQILAQHQNHPKEIRID